MSFPANVIPVFGSQRAYADLNFAGGSFGLDGRIVKDPSLLSGWSFTRASLAMGYDATGKLTYGPNNLCLQSQTFDSATWAKALVTVTANAAAAPDGTLTADRFVSAGGSFPQIAQSITVPAGNIVVSFWVQSDGTSQIAQAAIFDGVTVPFTPTSTWTQVIVSKTGSTGGSKSLVIATNNGSAAASSFYIWGAQLEAVTYQTTPSTYYPTTTAAYYGPRLVYDPVTLASLGILVEEARTNLALQSQTFGTTWTQTNVTVGDNITTSPDGTTNADSLIETAAAGVNHRVTQSVTTTAVATTFSCYLRAGSRSWAFLRMSNSVPANCFAWVNLATGVLGTVSGTGATATVQSVGNGWYRLALTVATAVAGANTIVVAGSTGDNVQDYDGTNGLTAIYAFGAQVELGQGASSPIPTTTASVTRAADDVTLTGLSVPDGCTVMFEAYTPEFVSTDARMSLSTGSTSNRMWAYYNLTNLKLATDVAAGGVLDSGVAKASGVASKFAISSSAGAYAGAIDGVAVTPATGTVMPTLTQLDIGKNAGTSLRYWNAPIKRMQVWKSVRSVTSITS